MVPSGFNWRFETFDPGLENRGRFVTLKASRRICRLNCRPKPNCRKTLRSHCATPGPRRKLYGAVPKRASVTGVNAIGSKYELPRPVPPRISTSSFTTSARWSFDSGAFKDVLDALTVNGVPL